MSWDERYSAGSHVGSPPLPFLVDLAERLPHGGTVLDLACGTGRHASLFADHGWEATGLDSSGVALQIIRDRDCRIQTVRADLEDPAVDLGGPWDLVIVVLYLQRGLFPRIRAAVKPGFGSIAMAIPLVDSREEVKPMNPLYLLQPGELEAEFRGWTIEHSTEREPDPPARRTAELVAIRPDLR